MWYNEEIFTDKKFNKEKLLKYGFIEDKELYKFKTFILDKNFTFNIFINKIGNIDTSVFDINTNDEYILYKIDNAKGSFVGKVRKECEDILIDIAKNCFEEDIFKNIQVKRIEEYILKKYDVSPEFLWDKFKTDAIFREIKSKKWFGILMQVEYKKLNINKNGLVNILDLKADENFINTRVDDKSILKGYHMNKKYWITIPIDESIKDLEIFSLIDKSYEIVGKGKYGN
jgi:predicted DNA-binding protein (MmcQ/YjbR family)